MAEAAGLALGVLGIVSLFTSCVENFDIVVRAKEFSKEFDLQCTLLSVQRFRLGVWGESLGLVESKYQRQRHNQALEKEDLRSVIVSTLNQLCLLLNQADVVAGRYALQDEVNNTLSSELVASSKGMTVFRESFEKFRDRLKRNQKQKSVWMVTRWSIYDQAKFETLVANITKLIDGLEAITAHLGLVSQQHAKLEEEIASLSDTQSLRLLQEVGSIHGANDVLRATSDTASVRLTLLTSSSGSSYHTAPTAQSHRSMYISTGARRNMLDSALQRAVQIAEKKAQEGGTEPISYLEETSQQTSDPDHQKGSEKLESSDSDDIPQHQRWMAALTASKSVRPQQRPFLSDNSKFGTVLSPIRDEDEEICTPKLAGFMAKTGVESSQAQRIFIELRNIRRAAIPFISAAPVGDALDKILASVEGPPGTPYEGGIFWITVHIKEKEPPSLRFHTRVYHPNIDHTGRLCADYHSWWAESNLLNTQERRQQDLPWFSRLITNQFNLGALLVAVCGLLADPNIDDPLVPEIAAKYITDYDDYHASAAFYTSKYARAGRPRECDLVFADHQGDQTTADPAPTSTQGPTLSLDANLKATSFMSDEASRNEMVQSLVSRYNREGPPEAMSIRSSDSHSIKSRISEDSGPEPLVGQRKPFLGEMTSNEGHYNLYDHFLAMASGFVKPAVVAPLLDELFRSDERFRSSANASAQESGKLGATKAT